ncbi:MAG: CapA family protein [Thermodesulfobacteriota bacterium]|nr:CapA family protein [Thermodesulfobacteriota bacterium]
MKKLISVVLVLMLTLSTAFSMGHKPSPPVVADDDFVNDDSIPGEAILVFGGDVMLDRNVEKAVERYGDGDYTYPFHKIADYLESADLLFANLESQISNKGMINMFKSAPWFRADPDAAKGLRDVGFDIVSMANNHVFDYGSVGMKDCFKQLDSVGIKYCGAGLTHEDAYGPVIMDVNDIKIAFLAYTNHGSPLWQATAERSLLSELLEAQAIIGDDNNLFPEMENVFEQMIADDFTNELFTTTPTSGVAWLYITQLEAGIAKAREAADIVVVSFHFGMDYDMVPSSAQDRYAHLAIDRRADLVIGHSPHVQQPVVKYNDGYIAYSLGNFVFDQRSDYHPDSTRSILLEVAVKDRKISEVKTKNIKINEGTWTTEFE